MSFYGHPDLARILVQDRRAQAERQARESHLRREHKRRHRHR